MPIGDYDLAADLDQMSLDAARACQIWLCLPDRSWATPATTTGDNENTVRSWAKRYRWKEVAARYDQSLSASLLGALRSVIVREAFNSVKVAIEIRDDEGVKPGARWVGSEERSGGSGRGERGQCRERGRPAEAGDQRRSRGPEAARAVDDGACRVIAARAGAT